MYLSYYMILSILVEQEEWKATYYFILALVSVWNILCDHLPSVALFLQLSEIVLKVILNMKFMKLIARFFFLWKGLVNYLRLLVK